MSERFPVARLERFIEAAFTSAGALPQHAAITARRLIEADLRGRSGHGLMRLRPFVTRMLAGGINRDPNIRLVRETPASGLLDGDNGLGPVVVTRAVEIAIAKARQAGVAWVGTRHSNHAGAAGVYTALALREGLIGMYFAVAAGNTMPPWGGMEPLLGTNPLAIAIPAGEEVPFQLDIATTVASHGSIRVKELAGEPLPEGWVVDRAGQPVTDPARVGEGFLVPIGGYKGAGLNLAIGLLAGVLNGAAFGREVVGSAHPPGTPTNTGQAVLVIDPGAFAEPGGFAVEMDRQLRVFRASASGSADRVRLPGDEAVALEARQRRDGIGVPDALLVDLRALADELGLADRLN
ncbi:MAG TPA: Ldh family oxidoreductase [Acidimicrobiia bacterium]|nr:Ldh family oxidoreductase [Acidimicrobiia bacterium]